MNTAITPAQATALRALARNSRGADASPRGGYSCHDARGLLVQISYATAKLLDLDGLAETSRNRRLVLTDAGRAWVEANP